MISTIADIGFWPTEINLSLSHWGLSVFFTFVIKQLPKAVHPWFFSLLILTFRVCLVFDLIFFSFNFNSFPKPDATRSLVIPLTPRQSGLLGVIYKSIRLDFDFEKNFLPIFFSNLVDNSVIPSLSLDKFNSDSEQSIP